MITETLVTINDKSPFFTVNTAAQSVHILHPTINPADLTPECFQTGLGINKFAKGDNLKILSIGFLLPQSFSLYGSQAVHGSELPKISLEYVKADKTSLLDVTEFGGGISVIPFEGYENYNNIFCDVSIIGTDFYLRPTLKAGLTVSMLNVPAAYNGLVFSVPIFIKIEHTSPMLL